MTKPSPMMRLLLSDRRGGIVLAWLMFRASWWHARGYGVPRWEAFIAACQNAWSELRR